MTDPVGETYLESVRYRFRVHKKLAEGAMEQLSDDQLLFSPGQGSNCIAIILQHLHGNMMSRWTDFLTTDGEKPTRERDAEFVLDSSIDREERMRRWEEGWACLFEAIEPLTPEDLLEKVTIRGATLSVLDAIERQVFHIAYHVGQIVYVARLLSGPDWRYLSVEPGKSKQYRPRGRD